MMPFSYCRPYFLRCWSSFSHRQPAELPAHASKCPTRFLDGRTRIIQARILRPLPIDLDGLDHRAWRLERSQQCVREIEISAEALKQI